MSDRGLAIFGRGYPASRAVSCDPNATATEVQELTVTAGGSTVSYDATTDTYTYAWKTDRAWSGQCRRLYLRFSEGSEYTALFRMR